MAYGLKASSCDPLTVSANTAKRSPEIACMHVHKNKFYYDLQLNLVATCVYHMPHGVWNPNHWFVKLGQSQGRPSLLMSFNQTSAELPLEDLVVHQISINNIGGLLYTLCIDNEKVVHK